MIDFGISTDVQFLADQSDAGDSRYVFAYTVTIANCGSKPARLLSRHWLVTSGAGEVREVRGSGVVGKQPNIAAGQSFAYTSAVILNTPVGAMHGSYEFMDDDGLTFSVVVPAFSLAVPNTLH